MQSVIKKKDPQNQKEKKIYILHKENECTVRPKVAVFCMQIFFLGITFLVIDVV